MAGRICPSPPTPLDLLAALRKGEEEAALEALEQWLSGDPCPMALCPLRAVELVVDLARVACEAGADPSAVAAVGLEGVRRLWERRPDGDVREPLREATRQWAALVRAQSPVSEEIRAAVAYLHTHYASPDLKREEVVQAARLCLSRFLRKFQKEMGVTYEEYLTTLRVEEAKRLLADPSLSLEDIAEDVGYQALSSLYRAFKRVGGMTPAQYRRRLGGGPGSP